MWDEALLEAAGALRSAYERVDWATTPLGPMTTWTPALRHAADLALHTRFPATLLWGPSFVMVYNEAYAELIADKHPAALGAPAERVFPEIWAVVGPMLEGVLAGRGATWVADAPLPLMRRGRLEEAYFTFSYSAVHDVHGAIEGVLDIATETTTEVVVRRRLSVLRRLADRLDDLEHVEDVARAALPVLLEDHEDLPAVALRLPGAANVHTLPEDPVSLPADGDLVVEERAGERLAWLPLGPARADPRPPMLVVALSAHQAPDEAYLGFLRLIGAALTQAIDRITAREAERGISETLQRSLLTAPPPHDHVHVAVRYLPAAERAQVGGDWYDAFVLPGGALTLVIGDVSGHDRYAAAAMAQLRNLLRGVAFTVRASPAAVLSGLDDAMRGLAVGVSATAVLAWVEHDGRAPARRLRWSNAGHPPPVIVDPAGRARLLETDPDILLGAGGGPRADHTIALPAGTTVVFYTDGLVERRGHSIDDGLRWLTETVAGGHEQSAERLADRLVAQLEGRVEDDVALLVLRAT